MIRDLEEGTSPLHDRRGSLQERGRPDRVKQEIVRLALAYGLTSSQTSFVAVEKRETPVEGQAQLRRIPVALTRGWGAVDQPGAVTGAFPAMAAAMPPRAKAVLRMAAPAALAFHDLEPAEEEELGASFDLAQVAEPYAPRPSPSARRPSPTPPASRALDRLVSLQRADGTWELTDALCAVLGVRLPSVERLLAGATGEAAERRTALATALALAWLERRESATRDEWTLLAAKAERWLRNAQARPGGGIGWLEVARSVL
jgi:Ca-activated chloride channel family protein